MAENASVSFECKADETEAVRAKNECLRRENECLKARLCEAEDAASKAIKECELQHKVVDELQGKVKFLEGQIEAYQYCMNCRR